MDTFFEGASPPEAIPRVDPSSNPFRDDPDLLSFGASTRTREPSPSPTPTLYRPPTDTLRSPTPSPDAGAAARNAQQDAVHGYDRDAGAVGQLGRRTDAPARGGVDDDVDIDVDARPHRVRSLDADERRELDFWRDEARVQEELRRVERDRQSAGLSPQRIVGSALRERADVSMALEILNLDPKAIVTTGDRKDIDKQGESAKIAREITAITNIEDLFDAIRAIVEVFSGVT